MGTESLTEPGSAAGACPVAVAGSGLEEADRKYVAHVRKYLLLYIRLLAIIGDLDSMHTVLHSLKQASYKSYADIYQ